MTSHVPQGGSQERRTALHHAASRDMAKECRAISKSSDCVNVADVVSNENNSGGSNRFAADLPTSISHLDAHETQGGESPLLIACRLGHLEAAIALLGQGADVEQIDRVSRAMR